jgi:hypothetical protein
MTRPDYCPVAQEPCQAMCSMSDVRCKIRDSRPQPKREWVGLTDMEIQEIYQSEHWEDSDDTWDYERAIEAKLKEKNT